MIAVIDKTGEAVEVNGEQVKYPRVEFKDSNGKPLVNDIHCYRNEIPQSYIDNIQKAMRNAIDAERASFSISEAKKETEYNRSPAETILGDNNNRPVFLDNFFTDCSNKGFFYQFCLVE